MGNFDVRTPVATAAAVVVALQGLVWPSGGSTADLPQNPTELPNSGSCLGVNVEQNYSKNPGIIPLVAPKIPSPFAGSSSSFEEVVQKVLPSTVSVNGWSLTDQQGKPALTMGAGSGFIVQRNGDSYVVTNAHVVEKLQNLEVTSHDGKVSAAKVIGIDNIGDIAVLELTTKVSSSPILFGDSDRVPKGALIFTIGNPLDQDSSVTFGIISAKNRNGYSPVYGMLQTDAAINPGNSGGPIFNHQGEVVGVVRSIKGGAQNIGYAIPSNYVKWSVNQILDRKPVAHSVVGVALTDLSQRTVLQAVQQGLVPDWVLKLRTSREYGERGALVLGVAENGPAKGKLLPGDIIVAVNGTEIKNEAEARTLISKNEFPNPISLTVLRRDKLFECKISTVPRPPDAHPLLATTPLPSLPTL